MIIITKAAKKQGLKLKKHPAWKCQNGLFLVTVWLWLISVKIEVEGIRKGIKFWALLRGRQFQSSNSPIEVRASAYQFWEDKIQLITEPIWATALQLFGRLSSAALADIGAMCNVGTLRRTGWYFGVWKLPEPIGSVGLTGVKEVFPPLQLPSKGFQDGPCILQVKREMTALSHHPLLTLQSDNSEMQT